MPSLYQKMLFLLLENKKTTCLDEWCYVIPIDSDGKKHSV
ncbi:hypothetical protein RV13_GL004075 [Enterococcus raffinosus]|nr:hypothetical protein RV13_GL004075 [Enterococcus raffinosus]